MTMWWIQKHRLIAASSHSVVPQQGGSCCGVRRFSLGDIWTLRQLDLPNWQSQTSGIPLQGLYTCVCAKQDHSDFYRFNSVCCMRLKHPAPGNSKRAAAKLSIVASNVNRRKPDIAIRSSQQLLRTVQTALAMNSYHLCLVPASAIYTKRRSRNACGPARTKDAPDVDASYVL